MRELRERDVRAVLAVVGEAHHAADLPELRTTLMRALPALVRADSVSYNEVAARHGVVAAMIEPELPERFHVAWARWAHQNPILANFLASRDGRPYRLSDFLAPDELRSRELYRDVYAPLGIEHQIAFTLPSPPTLTIALAVNRGGPDFDERDRRVLDLARPHLIQAYNNAKARAEVRAVLHALGRGLDEAGRGVVVLERAGEGRPRVAFATPLAVEALAALGDVRRGAPLPGPLDGWLRGRDASTVAAGGAPFVVPGRAGAVARLVAGRGGEPDVVLVEYGAPRPSPAALRDLGLTARQAEVLHGIALGRRTDEIAAGLGVSPRTVHKHLEHVFAKLGVSSRVEAVATAWSALGAPS